VEGVVASSSLIRTVFSSAPGTVERMPWPGAAMAAAVAPQLEKLASFMPVLSVAMTVRTVLES